MRGAGHRIEGDDRQSIGWGVGGVSDIVERLLSNAQLPICPYHRLSPEYWTTNDTDPCKFCGTKNDLDAPDKCTGADMRIMIEAANEIERLRDLLAALKAEAER